MKIFVALRCARPQWYDLNKRLAPCRRNRDN